MLDAKCKEFFVDLSSDGLVTGETDLELRRALELTYSVTSDIDFPAGRGTLSWRASYNWRDDYEATITNYPGS